MRWFSRAPTIPGRENYITFSFTRWRFKINFCSKNNLFGITSQNAPNDFQRNIATSSKSTSPWMLLTAFGTIGLKHCIKTQFVWRNQDIHPLFSMAISTAVYTEQQGFSLSKHAHYVVSWAKSLLKWVAVTSYGANTWRKIQHFRLPGTSPYSVSWIQRALHIGKYRSKVSLMLQWSSKIDISWNFLFILRSGVRLWDAIYMFGSDFGR